MPSSPGHLKNLAASFHFWIVSSALFFLLFTVVGSRLTHMSISRDPVLMHGFDVALAIALALAAVLYKRGKAVAFDALVLTVEAWAIYATISPAVPLIAHLGYRVPLMDSQLAHLDSWLGVSVPAIASWSRSHWLGSLAISSYKLVRAYVILAFFLPLLARRYNVARTYLAANLIAGLISLPCMYIAPAAGPWFAYHLAATKGQMMLQASLFALRQPGPCVLGLTGILCIPSFHVIWALLCAYALWHVRPLRIPAAVFSALLIFSTLATGWHYFVDVIAGAFVALASIRLARAFVRSTQRSVRPETIPESTASLRVA